MLTDCLTQPFCLLYGIPCWYFKRSKAAGLPWVFWVLHLTPGRVHSCTRDCAYTWSNTSVLRKYEFPKNKNCRPANSALQRTPAESIHARVTVPTHGQTRQSCESMSFPKTKIVGLPILRCRECQGPIAQISQTGVDRPMPSFHVAWAECRCLVQCCYQGRVMRTSCCFNKLCSFPL